MTKKHFVRAAEIVREDVGYNEYKQIVAKAFIQLFSTYNDRFDTARFLAACGLGDKA